MNVLRSALNKRLYLLIGFCCLSNLAAASNSQTQTELFRELKGLPIALQQFPTVAKLVISLVKLNPLQARKYVSVGITRFKDDIHGQNAMRLIMAARRFVKESKLTKKQKTNINKQLFALFNNGNYQPIFH